MLNYSWSDDYSVGNSVLDDHHKNLLNLFNDAYKLITTDAGSEQTIKLISELRVYAIFHFSEEEKLMAKANYPNLDEHIKAHKTFVDEVDKFKQALSGNTAELNEEIFIFLSNWLINHIQKIDKQYQGNI